MKKLLFSVFLVAVFCSVTCTKNSHQNENQVSEDVDSIIDTTINESYEPVILTGSEKFADLQLKSELISNFSLPNFKKQATAKAHAKYLKDTVDFARFDYATDLTVDKCYGIVGSDVCTFYEDANISSINEVKNLTGGIPVPIGTVLPILSLYGTQSWESDIISEDVISETNYTDIEGYTLLSPLEFEDEYNFFYKVKYDNKIGLIFGADLLSINSSEFQAQYYSLLYKNNGHYEQFMPFTHASKRLNDNVMSELKKNRLAFETVPHTISYFDDLVDLYSASSADSNFITTDVISHVKHVIFDESLQRAEENFFIPKLYDLVDAFLEELDKVNTSASSITAKDETLVKAKDYFSVAKALIDISPNKIVPELYFFEDVTYEEKNIPAILSKYSKTVQDEVQNILDCQGVYESPLFTFADGSSNTEDYSQYRVRGHYTKNGILATYFRVMMWFGRTNFIISDSEAKNNLTGMSTEKLSRNMLPIALLINDIVNKNDSLYKQWADCFDPITALVGISDDLSFYEVLPLWRELSVGNLKDWSSNIENLRAFLLRANEELEQPSISGSSLFQSASAGTDADRKPPMGFRLFGQRYTVDAHILTETTAPRILFRVQPSSLDILAALASENADQLLKDEYARYSKLEGTIKKFKTDIEKSGTSKAFGKTYYGTVLAEIASLAKFETGLGFYFTESPLWAKKQLNTQLGVLAELKHDTILYAKQSGAELGGGGGLTYRIKPCPSPINYVEPNLPFFETVIASSLFLSDIYKTYKLADEATLYSLDRFVELCSELRDIVKLEIEDKPISEVQNTFLNPHYFVPRLKACMQLQFGRGDVYNSSKNTFPIVTDVFTDYDSGRVLEFGTGIPYKIYVALNDGQGGKRIAVGYCFNAYEFYSTLDKRLTDEEWRETVYGNPVEDLESYKPEWLRINYIN